MVQGTIWRNRDRNTSPVMLFPPNEVAHDKRRKLKINILFPKQDYWEDELIEESIGYADTYLKLWKFIPKL